MQAPIDRETTAREYLPRGIRLGRLLTRRCPQHRDEAESVAIAATAEALVSFREGAGRSFPSWADMIVRNRIDDYLDSCRPKGHAPGRRAAKLITEREPSPFSVVEAGGSGAVDRPGDGDPIGWEIESEESVLALTAALPAQHRGAVRCRFLHADATTQAGAGRRLGLAPNYAAQLYMEGLEMIRAGLGAPIVPRRSRAGGRPGRRLDHDGLSLTVGEWSRRTGLGEKVLKARLSAGWDVARTLTTPARGYTPRRPGEVRDQRDEEAA
jgi:hypothetical protein